MFIFYLICDFVILCFLWQHAVRCFNHFSLLSQFLREVCSNETRSSTVLGKAVEAVTIVPQWRRERHPVGLPADGPPPLRTPWVAAGTNALLTYTYISTEYLISS
jgi:hypothetical protein